MEESCKEGVVRLNLVVQHHGVTLLRHQNTPKAGVNGDHRAQGTER